MKSATVIGNSEMVEYIEGLYFRFMSLEMVIKLQYVPSQIVEISNETKEFYLEKFNEARAEYHLALNELKKHYFPDSKSSDNISVNFETYEITLTEHKCTCGGNCAI